MNIALNSVTVPLHNGENIETIGVFHGFVSWIITLIIVLVVSLLVWKILIPFLKHCLTAVIEREEKNMKLILSTFETAVDKIVEKLSKDIQEVKTELKDLKKGRS